MWQSEPVAQPELGKLHAALLRVEGDLRNDDAHELHQYVAIFEVLLSNASAACCVETMDDTIAALRLLLERMPSSHRSMAALYDLHGHSLLARWRTRPDGMGVGRQDLDDAVEAYHHSLDLTLERDRNSINRLRNLADVLEERFVRDGSCKDLGDIHVSSLSRSHARE